MSNGQTIAIDFDGVVHGYSRGYHDGTCYDGPVLDAVHSLKKLENKGYHIVIFTARDNLDEVQVWLERNLGYCPDVTNKKPKATAYIDDRAIRFTNWKDILNYF